jgi:pimeloyl-[acyl-carrier protein] methyl ester esterase
MALIQTSRGLDWCVDTTGAGETVVLIHGFGASGCWWQAQKDFLRTDHQVVTLDLPGHGQSSWMPLTLTEMAADIREILHRLGISRAALVGSSLGGLVALELYQRMTEDVTRISLVGSIPKFAHSDHYPAGLDIDRIRTLSQQFNGNYAAILDIFFRSLFTMKERQSEHFKSVKDLCRREPLPQREALKFFLDILENTDLRDQMGSVRCPLQFITGTEDYICPRATMDWLAARMSHARFDFIEGCGHLPFLVEAKEYNRLLGDFLVSQ